MGIMITGGGTIGSQVARAAICKNLEDVVLFDISPNECFIHSLAPKCIIEQGSILDMPRMLEIIKSYNIERIIHTAVVPEQCENIHETINVNINGTTNLFEVARLSDVKTVINCSSAGVYDFSIKPTAPVNENHPISVKKEIPYYSTKISTEAIAQNYTEKFGLDIVTLRLAGNYGPSIKYNMGDKKWLYSLIKDALTKQLLDYDIVPKRHLPWTYAKDTADCLVHIAYLEDLNICSPVYNCAYPELYGLPEMIDALKNIVPNLKVSINEIEEIGWKQPFDISKLEKEFGYKFKYGPLEAFEDYIDWLKDNPEYLI